jgi:hypothetical protein
MDCGNLVCFDANFLQSLGFVKQILCPVDKLHGVNGGVHFLRNDGLNLLDCCGFRRDNEVLDVVTLEASDIENCMKLQNCKSRVPKGSFRTMPCFLSDRILSD